MIAHSSFASTDDGSVQLKEGKRKPLVKKDAQCFFIYSTWLKCKQKKSFCLTGKTETQKQT